MDSKEIKDKVTQLMKELDELKHDEPSIPSYSTKLELLKAEALLLNVMVLNEVNWSFYYTKEEIKDMRFALERISQRL